MFGGLEIKTKSGGGSVSGTSQDGDTANASEPPAAAASVGGSAFGFLNTTTTTTATTAPEPVPAPAPASSFSFLNSSAPSTDETDGAVPSTTITDSTSSGIGGGGASGFSFMQGLSAPAPAPDTTTAVDEEPKTLDAPVAASSGFSFMVSTPSTDTADVPENKPEPSTSQAGATSGFSFLSTPAPGVSEETAPTPTEDVSELLTIGAGPPSAVHARTMSGGSNLSNITNDLTQPSNILEAAAAPPPATNTASSSGGGPPGLPAGAGVTFGTSSVKRNVVKKKKNRAQRVGAGAANHVPPTSQAASVPQTQPPAVEEKSARDAAAEAQKRAEEFMLAKSQQEAAVETKPPTPAEPFKSPTSSFSPPAIQPSPSTDEVLAAAQAAAEEAKIIEQKNHKAGGGGGGGGFMGTFFKGFGSGHAAARASPNTTATGTGSVKSVDSIGDGVDRLAKEQQGMQRAMAERQMELQKSNGTKDDGDDNDVVVSTSVGGYQPDLVEKPDLPESTASSFTPITIPPIQSKPTSSSLPGPTGINVSSTFPPSKAPVFSPTPVQTSAAVQKAKTPTMIFKDCQALFAESVQRAMGQVENVRSQQKMLLEERFVSIAKDRLATQQIEQAENQLQAAVEEEDYELADQLGQVVEGHKREKQEVALMLENIAKALDQLDSQKSSVVKSVAACFDDLTHRLEELKEKEAAAEQKDDEETLKQFASISKQLSAEQERLAQDLKHLERDEKLVAEERKELEDSISEQTGEIETRKEEATQKLNEVQEEIDELRKRLESKQQEAANLRTEMFGFEDAISKVRVKFSRQLTRVDKKERALKESRAEWEAEDSTHKKQKEAHELQVQSHSEALLAHDALLKSLESELRLSKDFSDLIPKQLGFGDQEKTDEAEDAGESNDENDLAQLQADVVKCEAAVSEAKIVLKSATSVIEKLQAERDSLTARMPELEAQKKAAAAKRDFKAAGKASKDIKDATARIAECEEELNGESSSKKAAAEVELEKLNSQLVSAREVAQAKEKVSGLEKMASLAERIGKLLETKKEVSGESASEENSVRSVGKLILDGQIAALKSEGQDLGAKYGGWNELMKQYGLDEPETVEENETTAETAPATNDEDAKPHKDDGMTSIERVKKVRQLMKQLSIAEAGMEEAAEKEDFEEAGRHQESLESIQKELEAIDLTDEEADLAMSDEPLPEVEGEDGKDAAPDESEIETNALDEGTQSDKLSNEEAVETEAPPEENGHTSADSIAVDSAKEAQDDGDELQKDSDSAENAEADPDEEIPDSELNKVSTANSASDDDAVEAEKKEDPVTVDD